MEFTDLIKMGLSKGAIVKYPSGHVELLSDPFLSNDEHNPWMCSARLIDRDNKILDEFCIVHRYEHGDILGVTIVKPAYKTDIIIPKTMSTKFKFA